MREAKEWARSATHRIGGATCVVLLLVGVVACSSMASGSSDLADATFVAVGSAEQVFVTDAHPGDTLELRSASDEVLATDKADPQGSRVFRDVPSGAGYRVRDISGSGSQSKAITVMSTRSAAPSTKIYDQTLLTGFDKDGKAQKLGGYGYLTVRDGTKLAINVRLPGPPDKGPYPTVVEYSGYAYARPGIGESSISPVWNALGYAVVDVNMRGTGCSGGAFDFFETNQTLDGYDAIETVARQPWALNHEVGMVGISYGGISQLFVAQANPPHLAAITPNSVIEGVTTTLYPGAILNTGFAFTWAQGRVSDAKPSSATTGQSWAWDRIKAGDATCKSNQKLHSQAVDLIKKIETNNTYKPSVVDPITPSTFVHRIKMPTFLSCQWEDEQTGGACAFLSDKFTGTKKFWSAFTNGTHIDSIGPAQIQRQFDLLELYVAHRKPDQAVLDAFAPVVYKAEMGVTGVVMPPDPIAAESDFASAQAAFDKLPRVQVLFDNGHGTTSAGAPNAGFEHGFTSFHDPSIKATPFFFSPDGSLSDAKPTSDTSASFIWDPKARPAASMSAKDISDVWKAKPAYKWAPLVAGKAVSWITAPLSDDLVVVGGGSADLWLQSTDEDTDLQVTISEVRPDGQELFVQNGWLRASYRKLDPARSTPLTPLPWGRKSDLAPLPKGKWAEIHVPLYAQGHAYRKGSRLRISIEAPGGDQPQWMFKTLVPKGKVVNSIASSPTMPSRVLLPVATGVDVPTPLPPACEGMRGQPCRTYIESPNTKGDVPAG